MIFERSLFATLLPFQLHTSFGSRKLNLRRLIDQGRVLPPGDPQANNQLSIILRPRIEPALNSLNKLPRRSILMISNIVKNQIRGSEDVSGRMKHSYLTGTEKQLCAISLEYV